MREFGATEWGRRWIRACALPNDTRMSRGRSYARQGAVVELEVSPGEISALVQGSRRRPYRVTISAEPLADAPLQRAMADYGVTLTRLYGRDAQDDCRRLLAAIGDDLFPYDEEPAFECGCPDWAVPCKHTIAVALAFARAVDEAPARWLAFRFLGQSPLTVLGGPPAPASPPAPTGPTAAEFWGDGPAPAGAAAPAASAPAESPLSRITPPPQWGPDDPDLAAVLSRLAAALAEVGDGRDLEAAISAAYAAPTPDPAPAPDPASDPAPAPAAPPPPSGACAVCGAQVETDWRFCPECGTRLMRRP